MSASSTPAPNAVRAAKTTTTATKNSANRATPPVAADTVATMTAPPRYAPIMVNEPWAKFNTPMRPKMRLRPLAMTMYSAAFERAPIPTSTGAKSGAASTAATAPVMPRGTS